MPVRVTPTTVLSNLNFPDIYHRFLFVLIAGTLGLDALVGRVERGGRAGEDGAHDNVHSGLVPQVEGPLLEVVHPSHGQPQVLALHGHAGVVLEPTVQHSLKLHPLSFFLITFYVYNILSNNGVAGEKVKTLQQQALEKPRSGPNLRKVLIVLT